ncbi:MAG: hypothetical protein HFF39_02310 [Lawsonibacter sp.]|nr:hypothetical protein [Lawsonibacter sp.]
MLERKRKWCWWHLLIDLFLFGCIVFIYLHPRPITCDLPIYDRQVRSVSVYVAGEGGVYCKEFSAQDAIPALRQIKYEPCTIVNRTGYTAPGCPVLEIAVHYNYQDDVFFTILITHSGLGDAVLVSTPELFNAYGQNVYYLGTWPDNGDFWSSVGVPEAEVPYDELPSRQFRS